MVCSRVVKGSAGLGTCPKFRQHVRDDVWPEHVRARRCRVQVSAIHKCLLIRMPVMRLSFLCDTTCALLCSLRKVFLYPLELGSGDAGKNRPEGLRATQERSTIVVKHVLRSAVAS